MSEPLNRRERVQGWRLWVTAAPITHPQPGDPPLRLQAPYSNPSYWRAHGVEAESCWPKRLHTARCFVDPQHQPPAPGCTCGVYACPNIADITWRARYVTTEPFIVIGRVTLHQAALQRSPLFRWPETILEYRAASASIDELWVCDYSTVPAKVGALREQIATSLASTYEVPVNLGRPEVTRRDEIDARVDRIFLADGRMPPRYQEYAS